MMEGMINTDTEFGTDRIPIDGTSLGVNSEDNVVTQDLTIDTDIVHLENIGSERAVVKDFIGIREVLKPSYDIHYIYLKSSNRVKDVEGTNKMAWSLQSGVPVYRQGVITINKPIEKIIAIECGSIHFNDANTVYTGLPRELYSKFGNGTNRQQVSVLIDELSSQSCIMPNGNRYHFIANRKPVKTSEVFQSYPFLYQPTVWPPYAPTTTWYANKNMIWVPTFVPVSYRYDFFKPITTIDSVTVKLYDPYRELNMDLENLTMVNLQDAFTPLRLRLTRHKLYQQTITVSGFTTGNVGADATLISNVNRKFVSASLYPAEPWTWTYIDDDNIQLNGCVTTGMTNLAGTQYVNVYVDCGFSMALKIICAR